MYVKNLFFKVDINKKKLFPEYAVFKNVFNKKLKFNFLLKKYSIKSMFLPNYINNNKNIGLSYYLINIEKNINKNNFAKDLLDESYFNLIHFKDNPILLNPINVDLNYFLNYNIHNLCLLEIYKVIILLNFISLIKN